MKKYIAEDPIRALVIIVCTLVIVGGFIFNRCKSGDGGLAKADQAQEQVAPVVITLTNVVTVTNGITTDTTIGETKPPKVERVTFRVNPQISVAPPPTTNSGGRVSGN